MERPGERAGHIRSYKLRTGRVGPTSYDAIARLWATLGVDIDGAALDPVELFGRDAPLVVEIGFGMGEATAQQAAAEPSTDLLAIEVHTPGVGGLLRLAEAAGLSNVRVGHGDATVLLSEMLAPGSLAGIRLFFPDPWPKARHVKRRIINSAFCDLAASRLARGGLLHVATDWPAYAEHVRAVVAGRPDFDLVDEVPWRPETRFERRGVAAGRDSHDIVARRR